MCSVCRTIDLSFFLSFLEFQAIALNVANMTSSSGFLEKPDACKKVLKTFDHVIGQIEAGQAQQVSCGAHQLKNKISKCEKIIKIGKYSKLKKV